MEDCCYDEVTCIEDADFLVVVVRVVFVTGYVDEVKVLVIV